MSFMQERLRMLEGYASAVLGRKDTLVAIAIRHGGGSMGQQYADAVQEIITRQGCTNPEDMTPQQFHAKQEADRRAYYSSRSINGKKAQRVSQQDHNYIVDHIYNEVHAGSKPAVRPMLEAYGKEHNRAPEWAKRVAAQTHPKKMGKTLAAKKDHPVLQDLKEGCMLSQAHKSTLQKATYSGLAELLFSGSQNVRSQRALQAEVRELRTRMTTVEAAAARANTRLDESEQWKADAVELYLAGKSYGDTAALVHKGKSTVNDYIRSLISTGKLPKRPARNLPHPA